VRAYPPPFLNFFYSLSLWERVRERAYPPPFLNFFCSLSLWERARVRAYLTHFSAIA
jgi:hypothetical protein